MKDYQLERISDEAANGTASLFSISQQIGESN